MLGFLVFFSSALPVFAESLPVAVSDEFVLRNGKLEKTIFEKSLNLSWYSAVYDYDLDVLANDFIKEDALDICVFKSSSAVDPPNENKTVFKDIAKVQILVQFSFLF